jgi:hypothetical protein
MRESFAPKQRGLERKRENNVWKRRQPADHPFVTRKGPKKQEKQSWEHQNRIEDEKAAKGDSPEEPTARAAMVSFSVR